MSDRPVGGDRSSIRPALGGLVPYEPGKPIEEVQRELGLDRVVKLASNEGPYGPFPAAEDAIARTSLELNRYPDGGAWRLRHALAVRHGVGFENVTVCAGADAVIGFACMATLDPGDEAITGWPSFPSYVLDPLKLGGVSIRVPLRDERFDLDAILAAITARTKLVFIAAPNNPTGTTSNRAELAAYFASVPPHVLTVVDQAYFEYIEDPDYPDAIEEFVHAGHNVLVLRTFSKIFGLAGLRVGYGVGPEDVITAIGKVRRAFDVSSVAQEAALASLADHGEIARRRIANREAMTSPRPCSSKSRARSRWLRRRELPLRSGRRCCQGQRRAASPGSHRPSARPVRGSGRSPDHCRYVGRDRLPRARARRGIGAGGRRGTGIRHVKASER